MLKKRIPTLLGIVLLLVGITTGVYLVELGPQPLTTRATPEITPAAVRVTNISSDGFSVSWTTSGAAVGWVRYGTSPTALTLVALDDRDNAGGKELSYTTHHVSVSGLAPQTTYSFVIVSGPQSLTFDDNGQPYAVKTGPVLEAPATPDSAFSSIFYPDLSPASGALVYLTLPGGSALSALSDASGKWSANLSSMRSEDATSFLAYDPASALLSIAAAGADGTVATAVTLTSNDSPVPDIVLGKTYDFTSASQETGEAGASESQFSTTPLGGTGGEERAVDVQSPAEGEAVNTTSPEFFGVGPAGEKLDVTLESEHLQQSRVTVGANGRWQWSPEGSLEPGEHFLTIKWVDESGITRTLRRRFVVYAQEESSLPAFEATPSATGTPTPLPTSSPTPTPTRAPTPTATPTVRPASPSAVATEPAVPVPGTGWFTLLVVLGGLGLVSSGLLVLRRQTS